jgi:hypothetical protein
MCLLLGWSWLEPDGHIATVKQSRCMMDMCIPHLLVRIRVYSRPWSNVIDWGLEACHYAVSSVVLLD